MTRYLLDTNIVSNITKANPSEALQAWMAEQPDEALHVSALTVAEIRRGILDLPSGRRRAALEAWFDGPDGPSRLFSGRVVPFDDQAALIWADLMAAGSRQGTPRNALDMIIAASAMAAGCVIVSDNTRDFAGIEHLNPLRG